MSKKELLESMLRTSKLLAEELANEESDKRFDMVSNKIDAALHYFGIINKEAEIAAPRLAEGIATC